MNVVIYRRTNNLGDAIQSIALSRLLPEPIVGAYRNDLPDAPLLLNGWFGEVPPPAHRNRDAIFAGVFVRDFRPEWADWMRACDRPVGARDPLMCADLLTRGVDAEFIGCATLTLPRYDGPRYGVVHIDYDDPSSRTNWIASDVPWHRQWQVAMRRIEHLRHAAAVYTSRLHIALPCLALGTPVAYVPSGGEHERFSVLESLGVQPGRLCTADVSSLAARFREFLSRVGGITVRDGPPVMPRDPETWGPSVFERTFPAWSALRRSTHACNEPANGSKSQPQE